LSLDIYVKYINNVLKHVSGYKPLQLRSSSNIEDIINVSRDLDDLCFMDELLKNGSEESMFFMSYNFLHESLTTDALSSIKNSSKSKELKNAIISSLGNLADKDYKFDISSIIGGGVFESYESVNSDFNEEFVATGILDAVLDVEDEDDLSEEDDTEEPSVDMEGYEMSFDDEDDSDSEEENEPEDAEFDYDMDSEDEELESDNSDADALDEPEFDYDMDSDDEEDADDIESEEEIEGGGLNNHMSNTDLGGVVVDEFEMLMNVEDSEDEDEDGDSDEDEYDMNSDDDEEEDSDEEEYDMNSDEEEDSDEEEYDMNSDDEEEDSDEDEYDMNSDEEEYDMDSDEGEDEFDIDSDEEEYDMDSDEEEFDMDSNDEDFDDMPSSANSGSSIYNESTANNGENNLNYGNGQNNTDKDLVSNRNAISPSEAKIASFIVGASNMILNTPAKIKESGRKVINSMVTGEN
jgi:hypothetical protein